MPLEKTYANKVAWGVLFLLVAFLVVFGAYGKDFIRNFCEIGSSNSSRFDTRISQLKTLKGSLTYTDPGKDKATLQRAGFNLRKIIFEFPQEGEYAGQDIINIKDEFDAQIKSTSTMKTESEESVQTIWAIIYIQIVVFCLAIFHTMLTGCLLESSFLKGIRTYLEGMEDYWENVASYIANSSSSILLTLGIGGTFYGLLTGLRGSMSDQTQGFNVDALFNGLAISFTSTLAGVVLSILVRTAQQALFGPSVTIETLHRGIMDKNSKESIVAKLKELIIVVENLKETQPIHATESSDEPQ